VATLANAVVAAAPRATFETHAPPAMNEQLTVKNFGPITEATVDFKRVTVFIGPTGGGKSTLAKLAAIFRDGTFLDSFSGVSRINFFRKFTIEKYFHLSSLFNWRTSDGDEIVTDKELKFDSSILEEKGSARYKESLSNPFSRISKLIAEIKKEINELPSDSPYRDKLYGKPMSGFTEVPVNEPRAQEIIRLIDGQISPCVPFYILSERIFVSAIEYSWAGLISEKIGLPRTLVEFINNLLQTKREILELNIPFFNVRYVHQNGQDFIKIPESDTLFHLYETASGIQSVTPLLVLLEHLSRNTEQAQSFIIEEPELNLYPTAQQGLMNWLVEKCTKGDNDLTITTHSPYILSHFNLLLYAYQVGNQSDEKKARVKVLIPEESWINPDEFAAYYVNGPEGTNGVRSLINPETKLISQNGLDDVSGIQAILFDQLLDINSGF